MAINIGATYDKVVVRFDPNTLGIQHIRVFDGILEQGTIDRETSDGTNTRPGLYHPEDPDMKAVVEKVQNRRRNPDSNTTVGIALIYRFGNNNDVDVTRMNPATHPRYAFFMLMDPIHTEVRKRENINPFAGGSLNDACLTGQIRRKEEG